MRRLLIAFLCLGATTVESGSDVAVSKSVSDSLSKYSSNFDGMATASIDSLTQKVSRLDGTLSAAKLAAEPTAVALEAVGDLSGALGVSPSAMKAATFMFEAGSMNCGRNARKKNATLGLRIFVKTP